MMDSSVALWQLVAGIGALIAVIILFRPLLAGIWLALRIMIKPRKSFVQRLDRHRCMNARLLNRIAEENSSRQPNLADELRGFACRD